MLCRVTEEMLNILKEYDYPIQRIERDIVYDDLHYISILIDEVYLFPQIVLENKSLPIFEVHIQKENSNEERSIEFYKQLEKYTILCNNLNSISRKHKEDSNKSKQRKLTRKERKCIKY